MLHNEDRELQIRLAELQADVQINLTIGFAFFAVFFALAIGLQRIHFMSPPEEELEMVLDLVPMIVVLVGGFLTVRHFVTKAFKARKQMAELRKKYVW